MSRTPVVMVAVHSVSAGKLLPGTKVAVLLLGIYVMMPVRFVVAGHAVMRIIAGPAKADQLARQSLVAHGK